MGCVRRSRLVCVSAPTNGGRNHCCYDVKIGIFHNGEYWPKWMPQQALTFHGSCLAPNAIDRSGVGTYYILYSYDRGYVDNHPNDYPELNSFDISNAVDAEGRPVNF